MPHILYSALSEWGFFSHLMIWFRLLGLEDFPMTERCISNTSVQNSISSSDGSAPLPELMDRKKRDIMERKGDKEDENKRQKQQKESSAAAL